MLNGHTIWFTGLPCSGKTTIANYALSYIKDNFTDKVIHIDGDNIRETLCSDLGFSEEDRIENIRRISSICNFLNKQGISVVASFVSPSSKCQQLIQDNIQNIQLVYVSTPLEICEMRDVKGMYKQARDGIIKNFTGISAPYHIPKLCITINATSSIFTTIAQYKDAFDKIFSVYTFNGAFI